MPNPSHFTYTSIVQSILHAKVLYNPFYTVFELALPRVKNSNFEAVKKWGKWTIWVLF